MYFVQPFLLFLLPFAVISDWTDELRLTLANYALEKAANPPNGFVCSVHGDKPNSCHCWNAKGQPYPDQTKNDCHEPPQCLAYSIQPTGGFHFDHLNASQNSSLTEKLQAWNVPQQMYSQFQQAILFDSSTFVAFDFHVDNSGSGTYISHVGTARKLNGTIQLGWAYGSSVGDLVVPYVRTKAVPAGDCHGTMRGMVQRGYTAQELITLQSGLASYAFKMAAKQAQPGHLFPQEKK